jgi:hypothetical protein
MSSRQENKKSALQGGFQLSILLLTFYMMLRRIAIAIKTSFFQGTRVVEWRAHPYLKR